MPVLPATLVQGESTLVQLCFSCSHPHWVATGAAMVVELSRNKLLVVILVAAILHQVATRACIVATVIE